MRTITNEELEKLVKVDKSVGAFFDKFRIGDRSPAFDKCFEDLKAQKLINDKLRTKIKKLTSKHKKVNTSLLGSAETVQQFLESLPASKWTETFGGMPSTPGYPMTPTFCPASIFTNLKRVFFSGVNIIASLKANPDENLLRSLWSSWNAWITRVKTVHAKDTASKQALDNLNEVMNYLMNEATVEEFLDKFDKLAFLAYNPQQLLSSLNF